MSLTYVKTVTNHRISLEKFRSMVISPDLANEARVCYKNLKKDGVRHVVSSGADAKLLFSFLIYFFEQHEEYEKCAYIKKMLEAYVFLKLDKQ
jgi:hypothetical protein